MRGEMVPTDIFDLARQGARRVPQAASAAGRRPPSDPMLARARGRRRRAGAAAMVVLPLLEIVVRRAVRRRHSRLRSHRSAPHAVGRLPRRGDRRARRQAAGARDRHVHSRRAPRAAPPTSWRRRSRACVSTILAVGRRRAGRQRARGAARSSAPAFRRGSAQLVLPIGFALSRCGWSGARARAAGAGRARSASIGHRLAGASCSIAVSWRCSRPAAAWPGLVA